MRVKVREYEGKRSHHMQQNKKFWVRLSGNEGEVLNIYTSVSIIFFFVFH